MNEQERLEWKAKRIIKKIQLRGQMDEYLGCSYNLISMFENNKTNMNDERIEQYKYYIENYPTV